MSWRWRTWSVVALIVATATACGIPQDGAPRVVPGGVVHPALAAGEGEPRLGDSVRIFLVRAEQVVEVRRAALRGSLVERLNLLLEGPTQAEFGAGTRTAISPQTALRSARTEGDTAIVDLSGALVEVGGQEQILAVAQIVLTATAVPGVGQVRFLLEGQAVEIPRADGTLTAETLRATDYQSLRG
jgi:hypothetical protein